MKLQKEKVLLLALLVSSGAVYGRGVVEGPLDGGYDPEGTPRAGDTDNDYNGMSRNPADVLAKMEAAQAAARARQAQEAAQLAKGTVGDSDTGSTVISVANPHQLDLTPVNTDGPVAPTITTVSSVDVSDLTAQLDDDYTIGDYNRVVSGNIEKTPEYKSLIISKKELKAVLAEPVFKNFPNDSNDSELIKRFIDIKEQMQTLLDVINKEMRSGNTDPEKLKQFKNQLNALQGRCSELARDAEKAQEEQRQVQAANRIAEVNDQVQAFFKEPLVTLIMKKPSLWSFGKDPYLNDRSGLEKYQRQIDNSAFQLKKGGMTLDQYNQQIKNYQNDKDTIMNGVKAARRTQAENAIKSNNGLGYWDSKIETKYRNQINKYVDGEITLKQFKALIKPPKPSIFSRLFGSGKTQSTTSPNSESPSREQPTQQPVKPVVDAKGPLEKVTITKQRSSVLEGTGVSAKPEVLQSKASSKLKEFLVAHPEFKALEGSFRVKLLDIQNEADLTKFEDELNMLLSEKSPAAITPVKSVQEKPIQPKLSAAEMMDGYRYALRGRPDYVENVGDSLKKLELQVKTLFVNRKITMLEKIEKLPLDKQEEFNNLLTDLNLYQDRFLNRPTEISYKQYQKAYSDLEAQIQAARQ